MDWLPALVQLPEGEAKDELEKTLDRADRAIAEGRSAVYDLRVSATDSNDLSEALNTAGNELSGDHGAAFNLTVEGSVRDLRPIIRGELYRIAREALTNAFKHAHASHIEVEISYGPQAFRLRIRDDGEGIRPKFWTSAARDTSAFRECANEPNRSARN